MTSMVQTSQTRALRQPVAKQVAALCYRDRPQGREVLLITSSRGRWILPKGWPIDGLTDAEAAKQEAWEEAGVKAGVLSNTAIGHFSSEKQFKNGAIVPSDTQVFPMKVTAMTNDYPESNRRKRKWLPIADAIKTVGDAGMRRMLRQFARG